MSATYQHLKTFGEVSIKFQS